MYAGTRHDLLASVGNAGVEKNLALVGLATIDFYRSILPAKISVLADSDQLARLRQIMRSHEMGQSRADHAIAVYLQDEQRAGRIRRGRGTHRGGLCRRGRRRPAPSAAQIGLP